jgi:hypothetical protein
MVDNKGEANMSKQPNANTRLVRATKLARGTVGFSECGVAMVRFGNLEVLVTATRLGYKFKDVPGGISRHQALQYIERAGYAATISA